MIRWLRWVLLTSLAGLIACLPGSIPQPFVPAETQTAAPQQVITLPEPRLQGPVSLEEAIARRRSVRQFTDETLTLEEIGQLLWAAQGITAPAGYRTAPSAGALYPLEVYVVTEEGAFHYLPHGHQLAVQRQGAMQDELYQAALEQEAVREAPVVIVIAAIYERTAQKYGEQRSPRYVHLEAGHAAQNVLLQAVSLELGAVPIGAFEDGKVKNALDLPDDQQPLYLIPVGHPR